MELEVVGEDQCARWDRLVDDSPHGTVFHKSFWLTTCAASLNKKMRIYGCYERGELVGGCSLYVHEGRFLRTAESNAVMTPYGGFVLAPPRSKDLRREEKRYRDIVECLLQAFAQESFDVVRITNPPEFLDIRPLTWNGWRSGVRYAYYLDLDTFEENMSKDVRWTAKKAAKNGIRIRRLENPDPSSYYKLFSMTFKRQNLEPPATQEFLEKVLDALASEGAGEMWMAETPAGDIASAEIIAWDTKRAYRWSAASDTRFRETGATSLLLCEVFRDLKRRGFKEINLMAANTPQLGKFVASFNPRLMSYYSVERKGDLARIAGLVHRAMKRKRGRYV